MKAEASDAVQECDKNFIGSILSYLDVQNTDKK